MRSPLPTTVMQVASRLLVVWGVVDRFPAATGSSPAYAAMLLAWSATEVVRYAYFALHVRGADVPPLVRWLRYARPPAPPGPERNGKTDAMCAGGIGIIPSTCSIRWAS